MKLRWKYCGAMFTSLGRTGMTDRSDVRRSQADCLDDRLRERNHQMVITGK